MTNYDLFLMAQRLAGFQLTPQLSAFLYDMAIAIDEKPNKVGIKEVCEFAAKHDILNDAFDIKRECLTFYLAFLKDPDPIKVPAEPQAEATKEEEPKPFRLEVGKCYKRRDGEITKPLIQSDSENYPFTDGSKTWASDGTFLFEYKPHNYDLIEEYIEPKPKPFRLEYGKKYKSRSGVIHGPLVENDGQHIKTHPFRCGYFTWKENGQWDKKGHSNHPFDLIKEVE
jgi:hypothetical protein